MQGVAASVTDTLGNIKPWLQKVTAQSKPTDAKYFTTTKKGEIFELKAELNSERRDKKKEAVKKVIASMTVGKDVSALFPDVINCMQTDNLELKKLVYLYLMNYAKTQPDTAIMAVNTFVKDCDDPNPLIRALAVRTMGCIRVDKITAYLCDPLRKCLKDEDPYVRKTAAVCVAKLHDIDAELVEDSGFLELLRDLLCDSNPMVVANAVASISEILESTVSDQARSLLTFDGPVINKLLTALNECTEWGQVFILDAIADYTPVDDREAQSIVERVTPRLAHANAAVVLSTVKVVMKMIELIDPEAELVSTVTRKLAPPLVTLLSAEPEIQYVALRNINLIVQKRKDVLKQEMKVFFVKYNDPIYVKLEKLDIMIRLINQSNIGQVLAELKEYAKEVDVDFVRKAVRAIGRCAIKIESAAERCVSTLIELIQTKVNYVVQEAIIVIKDIFRKYPNKYESIISILCENLDTLDEPEARGSMIWIIGEYAERIDNADELLASFLDGFQDENAQVQLQLLTAIVKLFLKRPSDTQELVQTVLGLATQESDNPDLRDRGYIYWRLLSTDPAAAKEVVLAEKPLISEETDMLEPTLLDELICHLASLASVYHRPPSSFVEGRHTTRRQLPARSGQTGVEGAGRNGGQAVSPTVIPTQETLIGDLLDMDIGAKPSAYDTPASQFAGAMLNEPGRTGISDLLGDGLDDLLPSVGSTAHGSATFAAPTGSSSAVDTLADIFGGLETTSATDSFGYEPPMAMWLEASRGKGLEIQGTFVRQTNPGLINMKLMFTNHSLSPMSGFAIQFNKNSFGLKPAQPLSINSPLPPRQSVTVTLPLSTAGVMAKMEPLMMLQIAVKNNVDVLYFATSVPMHVLFVEEGDMEKRVFLATWKDIPSDSERQFTLNQINLNADACSRKLQQNNIFTVAKRNVDGQDMLYLTMKTTNNIWVLAELKIQPGNPTFTLSLKSRIVDVYPHVHAAFDSVLRS
ncbi:AP-1 complex subunit beta-1 [Clonorchis sinensis]|uniref:AP-1 complex subunit beta-1 n=1 Tax=Clonorchis sinensis TaxID=79923 RepID=A0A419QH57_CLOSI|nr:AP-1 complex subunit beta-1 [Clonorchis sinensis]